MSSHEFGHSNVEKGSGYIKFVLHVNGVQQCTVIYDYGNYANPVIDWGVNFSNNNDEASSGFPFELEAKKYIKQNATNMINSAASIRIATD